MTETLVIHRTPHGAAGSHDHAVCVGCAHCACDPSDFDDVCRVCAACDEDDEDWTEHAPADIDRYLGGLG